MNFQTHPPVSRSVEVRSSISSPRTTTALIFGPLRWAAFSLLFGICCLFAGKLQSAEFPEIFQPSTNVLKASMAMEADVQPNVAGAISQGGTNSSGLALIKSMADLDDKYRLAVGDRLSFRIVEDEEGPKQLSVTDSGDLEFPYLGRFPAVGKTCKELALALKAELEKEYYYQATVIIAVDIMTIKSRGRVYLVGPVRAPGPLELPSDEVLTLSKAILRAGGFTDFADQRNVKVTRKGAAAGDKNQIFTVNVKNILEKGKTDSDLPLQSGDLIYVPERLIRF